MSILLLNREMIKKCLTMKEAIDIMESSFKDLAKDEVILPLRTGIPILKENALSLTMPAYLKNHQALGLKVVSIFPNNIQKGIPTIQGGILLLDDKTGEIKSLMEGSYLTALRTGAVSGLATRYFTNDEPKEVAILGSGVQALTQLEAVSTVRTIKRVKIWSRDPVKAHRMAASLENSFPLDVCPSVQAAVRDADIICTATASTTPLFDINDVKPTVHINAIGSHTRSMQEIHPFLLSKSIVIVDQKEAALSEAGEIISAVEQGLLDVKEIKELGSLILQDTTKYHHQLTVFKSVGLAIQDIAVAQQVYLNAMSRKEGSFFDF